MVARKAKAVAPEQLEEFETAFRAFDKEGHNRLDLDQLSGALSSLGVSEVVSMVVLAAGLRRRNVLCSFSSMLAESERCLPRRGGTRHFRRVHALHGERGPVHSLDSSRRTLIGVPSSMTQTERLEDRPSGDKVRSCFRSIAGEKVRSTAHPPHG